MFRRPGSILLISEVGRGALVRGAFTEVALLAGVGGSLGLLLAYWGMRAFLKYGRRSQVYHIHNERLYEVIGEGASPSQRPTPLGTMVRRLMTLDVVLGHPGARILATAADKARYFEGERHVSSDLLPSAWHPNRCARRPGVLRYFPQHPPIVIEPPDDRLSFLYVQGPATTLAGFDTFLACVAPLLTQLPRVDVVFCSVDLKGFGRRARAVFERWRRTAASRNLAHVTALRADLAKHYGARKAIEMKPAWSVSTRERALVERGNRRFAHPHFAGLYGWWSVAGDRVLDEFVARQPVVRVAHVGLRLWPIPYRYDAFGTAIAHALRWRRRPRMPRGHRSDSARFVAA